MSFLGQLNMLNDTSVFTVLAFHLSLMRVWSAWNLLSELKSVIQGDGEFRLCKDTTCMVFEQQAIARFTTKCHREPA